MPLHAKPVGVAQELRQRRHRNVLGDRPLVVAHEPLVHAFQRPAEERILEQADRIVRNRPPYAVLEIQHRGATFDRHQVARHEIPMREHARLAQRAVHQAALPEFEAVQIVARQLEPEMPPQEPVFEQARIALQQRSAELARAQRRLDALQPKQLFDGRFEMRVGGVVVDDLRQRRSAKVFQQQETIADVFHQHLRHAHAAAFQQCAHAQPRAHVLQLRRRIHHDAAAAGGLHAPVTAMACIDRRAHQFQFGNVRGGARPGQARVLALAGIGKRGGIRTGYDGHAGSVRRVSAAHRLARGACTVECTGVTPGCRASCFRA